MDLMRKFNQLQYDGVLERDTPEVSGDVDRPCDPTQPGPLLYDVAYDLAKYLGASIVAAEKHLETINGFDWTDDTRELVMKQFVASLIARFIDGVSETPARYQQDAVDALAEFLASRTDLAYYHGA